MKYTTRKQGWPRPHILCAVGIVGLLGLYIWVIVARGACLQWEETGAMVCHTSEGSSYTRCELERVCLRWENEP